VLDPILADAAEEAGAELRFETTVTGLLEDDRRVSGVRTEAGDVTARLVVGADGRRSTVAEQCGSRRYNLTPNERALYWGFFEGVDPGVPTFVSHRWADRFVIGIPSDSGLYQALVWPEFSDLERFKGDLEGCFTDQLHSCEPLADLLAGARRVDTLRGAVRWTGFFREPSGPGWVLTGDAGHFKDPGPGRGISDALIQAEKLAPAIVAGLEGGPEGLDRAMADWGRWRDREFAEHYWFAIDSSKSGTVPAVLPEAFRDLHRRGQSGRFFDVINHRARPSEVFGPPLVARATAGAIRRRPGSWAAVLGDVASVGREDLRRRWRNRRPLYAVS
jgi:flavin-dependent dehydrogenase